MFRDTDRKREFVATKIKHNQTIQQNRFMHDACTRESLQPLTEVRLVRREACCTPVHSMSGQTASLFNLRMRRSSLRIQSQEQKLCLGSNHVSPGRTCINFIHTTLSNGGFHFRIMIGWGPTLKPWDSQARHPPPLARPMQSCGWTVA